LGTLSVMGSPRLRQPFEPLLQRCQSLPFGDLAGLREALATRRFAAFVVEPIQAEAGVVIPQAGYLAEAKALCRKYGTLRVLDDEQLVGRAAARGVQLLDGLRRRLEGHPLVREVRGQGLLVAVELGPTDRGWLNRLSPWLVEAISRRVFGQWAAVRLLER